MEALPLFTRGLVELPDHPTLLRELRLLERTPTRTGRDQVTHPRGCNDDYANAVCGALRILSKYGAYNLEGLAGWDEKEKQMSEPCPIPEGMTFEQYELMSRPVRMGGPPREVLMQDPQWCADQEKEKQRRIAEMRAKWPDHEKPWWKKAG